MTCTCTNIINYGTFVLNTVCAFICHAFMFPAVSPISLAIPITLMPLLLFITTSPTVSLSFLTSSSFTSLSTFSLYVFFVFYRIPRFSSLPPISLILPVSIGSFEPSGAIDEISQVCIRVFYNNFTEYK